MAQLYFHCTSPQRIFLDQCGSELDRGLRHLRTETKLWLSLWRRCFDPYRPELHYMRGPGPRWREKHRRALASERAATKRFMRAGQAARPPLA
jgi:hypothetical protein